jgi:hypothetical protein
MRKHTFAFALAILIIAPIAGAHAQTPAQGATEPVSISPEDLQRQMDGNVLPITVIDEPY